jgi:hypothetical protein
VVVIGGTDVVVPTGPTVVVDEGTKVDEVAGDGTKVEVVVGRWCQPWGRLPVLRFEHANAEVVAMAITRPITTPDTASRRAFRPEHPRRLMSVSLDSLRTHAS